MLDLLLALQLQSLESSVTILIIIASRPLGPTAGRSQASVRTSHPMAVQDGPIPHDDPLSTTCREPIAFELFPWCCSSEKESGVAHRGCRRSLVSGTWSLDGWRYTLYLYSVRSLFITVAEDQSTISINNPIVTVVHQAQRHNNGFPYESIEKRGRWGAGALSIGFSCSLPRRGIWDCDDHYGVHQ
jgi:hypothetical protein